MSLILPPLRRRYPGNDQFALTTEELSLDEGGFTCIIGSNGSGKSSFGESLAKTDSATQSSLWYYLPQYLERFLYAENILEQLETFLAQKIDRPLLIKLLEEFGFQNAEAMIQFPFMLMSGGERRRIALVCVFYLQPEYLILDEPDIGITEKENMVLLRKIGNLQAMDTRLILISHNHKFVKESTNLICLKDGAVDRAGLTSDLLVDSGFKTSDYGVRFDLEED